MVIGYINRNIPLEQLPKALYGSEFEKINIDKYMDTEVQGNAVQKTDDILEYISMALEPGDTIITSTLANFSQKHNEMLRMLRLISEKNARVITIKEKFDSASEEGQCLIKAMPILRMYEKSCNHIKLIK